MGSTGTGSFSDYSRRKPSSEDEQNGGSSGIDKCDLAFTTNLEDVTRCFFYANYRELPPLNSEIIVAFNGVRLVAENNLNEEIGYLPTLYNYLKFCMEDGYSYKGIISKISNNNPVSLNISVTPVHE